MMTLEDAWSWYIATEKQLTLFQPYQRLKSFLDHFTEEQ
jgi:hypothetical protein